MTREEVLIWLTQLGKDWVGLHEVYEAYNGRDRPLEFWESLQAWHDCAFITKRHNHYIFEKKIKQKVLRNLSASLEQYRLTNRALSLLTST